MSELQLDPIVTRLRAKALASINDSEKQKTFAEGFMSGVNTLARDLLAEQARMLSEKVTNSSDEVYGEEA